jgi:hypothetical protein
MDVRVLVTSSLVPRSPNELSACKEPRLLVGS